MLICMMVSKRKTSLMFRMELWS